MKNKKIAVLIILVICTGIAFYSIFSMSDSNVITPYVSFKTAIESAYNVQIIGKLNPSNPVLHREGYFSFSLIDKEDSAMNVICNGVKPANFEKADQIVVQGIYNKNKAIFVADKILIKCPSKYKKAN